MNESTGGRHPSHSESDPASLRLYCQRLALFQVRTNGATIEPANLENSKKKDTDGIIDDISPVRDYVTRMILVRLSESME